MGGLLELTRGLPCGYHEPFKNKLSRVQGGKGASKGNQLSIIANPWDIAVETGKRRYLQLNSPFIDEKRRTNHSTLNE
jgi:hypothetical protein